MQSQKALKPNKIHQGPATSDHLPLDLRPEYIGRQCTAQYVHCYKQNCIVISRTVFLGGIRDVAVLGNVPIKGWQEFRGNFSSTLDTDEQGLLKGQLELTEGLLKAKQAELDQH